MHSLARNDIAVLVLRAPHGLSWLRQIFAQHGFAASGAADFLLFRGSAEQLVDARYRRAWDEDFYTRAELHE